MSEQWLFFITTLPWVLTLALIGGGARYIRRINNSAVPLPISKHLCLGCGELFISGFAGLVTFLLCNDMQVSPNMTAVAVALSGHMGGNAIDLVTDFLQKRFKF